MIYHYADFSLGAHDLTPGLLADGRMPLDEERCLVRTPLGQPLCDRESHHT